MTNDPMRNDMSQTLDGHRWTPEQLAVFKRREVEPYDLSKRRGPPRVSTMDPFPGCCFGAVPPQLFMEEEDYAAFVEARKAKASKPNG